MARASTARVAANRRNVSAYIGAGVIGGNKMKPGDPGSFLVATTRFRSPYSTIGGVGVRYQHRRFYIGQTSDPEYGFAGLLPLFSSANGGGETLMTGKIRIIGWSLGWGPTIDPTAATWVRGKIKGADSYIMDPAVDGIGVVVDELLTAAQEIPAGSHRWASVSFDFIDNQAPLFLFVGPGAGSLEGGTSGSTEGTGLVTDLTSGRAMSQTGAGTAYGFAWFGSRSSKRRTALMEISDSIPYGDTGETAYSAPLGVQGFIKRGMDAPGGVGRRNVVTIAIPGSYPKAYATGETSKYAMKIASLKMAPNDLFTHILSGHGQNSIGNPPNGWGTTNDAFIAGMKAYGQFLRQTFPDAKLHTVDLPVRAAVTTDGLQTEANQTAAGGYEIGSRARAFSARVRADGVDGVFEKITADIQSLFKGSSDDKMRPYTGPINTTVTAFTQGTNKITVADVSQIRLGDTILADPNGVGSAGTAATRVVSAISGNELTLTNPVTVAVPVGAKLIGCYLSDMVHPSFQMHEIAAPGATTFRDQVMGVAA